MVKNKILEMKKVSKIFPGVKALDNVHLNVYAGQIMALLGENGAGKSTLMKILSGVYKKTEGTIIYKGKELEVEGTKSAQEKGITIIHQELNLIDELSIGENIFLGREPKKLGKIIDWEKLFRMSQNLLNALDLNISSKEKIKNLSIGHKQMVEIAKALSFNSELIIMDEPTDALTDQETKSLFNVIAKLKNDGKSIVYISHRLKEIFEICDDVTIIRDGQFIAEIPVAEITEDKLIEMMVGRKLEEQFPYQKNENNEVVLSVNNINNEFVRNVSFQLKKGEILGVAGLMGAGRTELAKSLFGNYKIKSGELAINGKIIKIDSEKAAIEAGIIYVSEDRKKDGLVLGMSIKDNISLAAQKKLFASGIISKKTEEKLAEKYVQKLLIKTPSIHQKVKNLSGGNQQKVSISKCLTTDPKILILDEPTRGIDVGAKKEIYDLINILKKNGMSILMISSEIPELLGMSDRIMVMHEGKVNGILQKSLSTQENIMKLAVGKECI
ncbi:MAG: ATP-binding cassette domain-containing protein [Fusobacteriaceae bacterium]|nr:ATP-binding cassette domain-containing protein [Fusobacteriaceae bacterium]